MKLILLVATLILGVGLYISFKEPESTVYGCMEKNLPAKAELECRHIREFKRPQMEGGCVYQESQGKVIKTCG